MDIHAAQTEITFKKQGDETIFRAIRTAFENNGVQAGSCTVYWLACHGTVDFSKLEEEPELASVLKENGQAIRKFSMGVKVGANAGTIEFSRSDKEPWDNIKFTKGNQAVVGDFGLAISSALQEIRATLGAVNSLEYLQDVFGADAAAYFKHRHIELDQLVKLNLDLTVRQEEWQREQEAKLEAKEGELRGAIAVEAERLKQRYEEKAKALEDERAIIKAREAEIDDSENMIARRALRQDIKEELKKGQSALSFRLQLIRKELLLAYYASLSYWGLGF